MVTVPDHLPDVHVICITRARQVPELGASRSIGRHARQLRSRLRQRRGSENAKPWVRRDLRVSHTNTSKQLSGACGQVKMRSMGSAAASMESLTWWR